MIAIDQPVLLSTVTDIMYFSVQFSPSESAERFLEIDLLGHFEGVILCLD